jgi:2-keto-4-pentenoate hydratase
MNILMSVIRLTFAMTISLYVFSSDPLAANETIQAAESAQVVLKTKHKSRQEHQVDSAYQEQQASIKLQLVDDKLAGFKAGLTSKAGQKKFNVSEPLHGALFESGRISAGTAISLSHYQKLMLELELGFVLNTQVSEPITSIEALKTKVAYIAPVIELPDLRFTDLARVTGLDLIKANVAANGFIMGTAIKNWQSLDINQLTANLYADSQLVVQGQGKDASGDQWHALLWLINQRVKLGDKIMPGQLLITGAMGKMIPAKIAQYKAEFGPLGVLEFAIVP